MEQDFDLIVHLQRATEFFMDIEANAQEMDRLDFMRVFL
jgi:hypothetical protein